MWERYAWFAVPAFGLCLIASVASYLWDTDYLWWPTFFMVLGVTVMVPLVVVRPLRAVLATLNDEERSESE